MWSITASKRGAILLKMNNNKIKEREKRERRKKKPFLSSLWCSVRPILLGRGIHSFVFHLANVFIMEKRKEKKNKKKRKEEIIV